MQQSGLEISGAGEVTQPLLAEQPHVSEVKFEGKQLLSGKAGVVPKLKQKKNGFVRQLWQITQAYRWRQVEVFGYMLVGISFSLVLPLSSKVIIDEIIPSGNLGALGWLLAVLFIGYLLTAAIQLRRAYLNNYINYNVSTDLNSQMFSHLQKLPHSFYTRVQSGDIMGRFTKDLDALEHAMSQIFGVGIYLALHLLTAAVVMVALQPVLGSIILGIIPLFGLCYLKVKTQLEAKSRREAELVGANLAVVQENLTAHSVIKAFTMEKRAVQDYSQRLRNLLKATLSLVVTGSLFELSISLATTFGQITVLGVGGYLVMRQELTVGTLLAFVGLLPALLTPIAFLANVAQTLQRGEASLQRINELLAEPITNTTEAAIQPVDLAAIRGNIHFDGVSFGYEGDGAKTILNGLSFQLPVGQQTAIVGASGVGKSTLANLLLRFWEPTSGSIKIDGQELARLKVEQLRVAIGIVFQDTIVFNTTIRQNLCIGKPEASPAEIAEVVRLAQLEDYLAGLPEGLETLVGERGIKMSGGERQRLGLARALLKKPQILILDEATSALDIETEARLLANLKELTPGCTVLTITHRLSVAASADQIIVLNQGQVSEQGSHEELLSQGGLYASYYYEQLTQFAESGTSYQANGLVEEKSKLSTVLTRKN